MNINKSIPVLDESNGIDETVCEVNCFEDLPESMQAEFADGKGGED